MGDKLHSVILACHQALPDPARLSEPLRAAGFQVRVIPEPCSSKVEAFQLLRILASEADILWVVGCPPNACQQFEGSRRLAKRVGHAQEVLKEIGVEPERLGVAFVVGGQSEEVQAAVQEIQRRAQALGVNPARAGVARTKESA